jgi:CubicO group peptidase (beta-lactamase class C family)
MNTQSALQAIIDANQAPGAVAALFDGDRITHLFAAGVRRVGTDLPMTPQTKARIASVSKVPAALALEAVAENGLVDLDSDISIGLGFRVRHPNYPESPISWRMVQSHTAGLSDAGGYLLKVGDRMEDCFKPDHPLWEGGRRWSRVERPFGWFSYCNFALGLEAQMVEKATGTRFDQAAKALVFDPLGIDCGYNWSGVPDAAVAVGSPLYRRPATGAWAATVDDAPATVSRPIVNADGGRTAVDYVLGSNGIIFAPQGGLRASVVDMAMIGMALTGARPVIKPETLNAMLAPQWTLSPEGNNGDTGEGDSSEGAFRQFAAGVHIIPTENAGLIPGLKRPLYGHYGDAYGLLAGLWVDRESRRGFAWFLTGSPADIAKHDSGIYAVEAAMMQAACADLGLA